MVLMVVATAPLILAATRVLDVKATLTGEVLEENLARTGEIVGDGDPLVYVRTLVGRGVAARAPVDGTVVEVLVRPGQVIRERGAVVVRLNPR
jgi:biotin carboxyl carrier protein